MKAVITDTHLKDSNCELVESIFHQVGAICKNRGVQELLHAGDWFTSRQGQSQKVLLTTKRIINFLRSDYDLSIVIIPGNHDKADVESEDSFLDVFHSMDFQVVRKNTTIKSTLYNIAMIPYFKESGDKYAENLRAVQIANKGKKTILITHIAVNGVKNNDGSKVESGVDNKAFSSFDKVLVGHYHDQSLVGDNIYYIGSAYQANFGENEDKGLTIINDYGDIEFIKLEFPKYVKYIIDAKDLSIKEINSLISEKTNNSQNNIRVVIKGEEKDVKSIDKTLLINGGISIVQDIVSNFADVDQRDEDFVSFNKDLIKEEFERFCEIKKTDKDYGLNIIEKCIN